MSLDDVVKIVAGVSAGVAAPFSLAFGIYQYAARKRQESLTEIIRGEKEAAAAAGDLAFAA
jgi:ABC-type methionine transport system permease subunit